MFKRKSEVDRIVRDLEKAGLELDQDFFVEQVKRVEYAFTYSVFVDVGEYEDDAESRAWEALSNREGDADLVGDVDSYHVGWRFTDIDGQPFDVDKASDYKRQKEIKVLGGRACCAICGVKVKLRMPDCTHDVPDQRIENDGVKCFDHIGVKAR